MAAINTPGVRQNKCPTPAALEKVRQAMAHVEAAQTEIDCARQALSPVRGMAPEWNRLGKLHEQVHAEWYRVRTMAEKHAAELALDSEPEGGAR